MKVKVTITQTAIIDTEQINDTQIKYAAERIAFNRERDNVGKIWVADWMIRYIAPERHIDLELL